MPFYASSKTAALSIAENLRGFLKPYNIDVTVINPSWVKSHLTDEFRELKLPLLFSLSVESAVNRMKRDIEYGRAINYMPFLASLLGVVTRSHTPLWKQQSLDTQMAAKLQGWYGKTPNRL